MSIVSATVSLIPESRQRRNWERGLRESLERRKEIYKLCLGYAGITGMVEKLFKELGI
jgi:hypothetical protein